MSHELRTERLRLRRARPDDLLALHAVLSDARATRFWSTPPHPDPETTAAWLDAMISSPPALSDDFVVELAGRVIGKAGCYRLPEIGFILHPETWGQGLAAEALRAVIPDIFRRRGVEAITADVDPRNTASLGLLSKLGFVETHRAARTWCVAGEWCDSIYLRLAAPEGTRRA